MMKTLLTGLTVGLALATACHMTTTPNGATLATAGLLMAAAWTCRAPASIFTAWESMSNRATPSSCTPGLVVSWTLWNH